MPRVKLSNRQIVAACEHAGRMVLYLQPGVLQYRYGQIRNALLSTAEQVVQTQQKLYDEYAEFEGIGPNKRRKVIPVKIGDTLVGYETAWRDAEAKEAVNRRDRELMAEVIDVELPLLLQLKHVEAIQKERLADVTGLAVPDLGALQCVFADDPPTS